MRSVFGPILVLALSFAFLPPAAHAGSCVTDGDKLAGSHCCQTSGTTTIAAPDGATFYLDRRAAVDSGVLWLYEERNGVADLQRGGVDLTGYHQRTTPALPTFGGRDAPVGSSTSAGVGATDLTHKAMLLPSAGVPNAVLYTRGSAPSVGIDPSGTHVGGGSAPSATVEVIGRYDGCYDQPTTVTLPDVNVL
jgi:hypothetical protein